ncbi:TonB-dependent receptor [Sphingobacterium sp. N143]|uniref:TonB-dependent receptor n=1 Tax=Sphingobacterium sp. N143 TaxID=2746727 RepID=UPI002574EF17|nr:TonB-dependent receptor [Sphingobacterium sp. N143]MDM1296692.1 TonB-dependent receptor [Sphingobacterium sp. N143]
MSRSFLLFSLFFIQGSFLNLYGQEKLEREIDLQEVRVDGNRYKHAMEGPLSVSYIHIDSLQKFQGGSLMQTLSRIPGVGSIGIGASQSKPQIRGLGFNRVITVENGIKHEGQQWGLDHGLEIDQYSIGSAEIIKGPSSFMYGSDAIGGVIRLSSVQEPEEDGVNGSLNLIAKSNNGTLGSSAQFVAKEGKFVFGGGITHLNYGDYRVPTDTVYVYNYAVGLKNNYVRNTAGRETDFQIRGGYITERFSSIIYLSNYDTKLGFFANAHGLEPRGVNTALYDKSNRDISYPSQKVNHFKIINRNYFETDDQKIWIDIAYQRNNRKEFNHYVAHGYMPAVFPDNMGIPEDLERLYDKSIYSIHVKDQFTKGSHQITVGGSAEIQHNHIGGWGFLIPEYDQRAAGLFAHDQYSIDQNTMLYAALRYDYSHNQSKAYRDWFESETEDGTRDKILRAEHTSKTFNSLVWGLGLAKQFGTIEAKLNIGKSFRNPATQEFASNGVNYHYYSYDIGDRNLSPEQSYQADLSIGWRKEAADIVITPFYNYFSNYIYLNPTSRFDQFHGAGNQIFKYSESKVLRYGGEINANFRFVKDWKLEVLGEFVKSKQLSGSKKGYTLPFSPAPSVLIGLDWYPKIHQFLNGTYFAVDCKWTAEQNNIVPPEEKSPSYTLFNFRAGTDFKVNNSVVQLRFQIQNLLDTKYMDHTSFYRLIALPEQGRNLILSARVPFGKK